VSRSFGDGYVGMLVADSIHGTTLRWKRHLFTPT
jgi:hypothetical protein